MSAASAAAGASVIDSILEDEVKKLMKAFDAAAAKPMSNFDRAAKQATDTIARMSRSAADYAKEVDKGAIGAGRRALVGAGVGLGAMTAAASLGAPQATSAFTDSLKVATAAIGVGLAPAFFMLSSAVLAVLPSLVKFGQFLGKLTGQDKSLVDKPMGTTPGGKSFTLGDLQAGLGFGFAKAGEWTGLVPEGTAANVLGDQNRRNAAVRQGLDPRTGKPNEPSRLDKAFSRMDAILDPKRIEAALMVPPGGGAQFSGIEDARKQMQLGLLNEKPVEALLKELIPLVSEIALAQREAAQGAQ